MMKRFLALLLAVVLTMSCLPVGVWAEGTPVEVNSAEGLATAVQNDCEIKLTDSFTLDRKVTVPAGKTVVLDLNGKALTSTDAYNYFIEVAAGGTLTVKDSSAEKTGGMNSSATTSAARCIRNYGTLTVEGGTFTVTSQRNSYAIYSEGGDVTITGGSFTGTNTSTTANHAAALGLKNSTAHISGNPEFIGSSKNTNTGSLVAAIIATEGSSTITIEGGIFTGNRTGGSTVAASAISCVSSKSATASATISGGSFSAEGSTTTLFAAGVTPAITGGTFSEDVSALLAAGYVQQPNGAVVKLEEKQHSDADHVCEHCDETSVVWTAWGDDASEKNLPTAAGHYYLTRNMEVQKVDLIANVVLCLNGKTVTCTGTYNSASDRFYYLKSNGSISIVDCTATGEGDTYRAGTFTGASASGIVSDSNTTGGSINIYDGIFTGNWRASSGGTICVQGKTNLNIYGGQFVGNSTDNGGAVIYLGSGNKAAHIENALFKNNHATGTAAVIHSGYGAQITIKDTVMTGNYAANAGVIWSSGALTLDNVQITGNRTVSGEYGAVTMAKENAKNVTIKGNTQITGNTYGDVTATKQRNLYLQYPATKIAIDSLATTASVGISAAADVALTDALGGANVESNFSSDDSAYDIKIVDDKLVLAEKAVTLPHDDNHLCQHCNTAVTWIAWDNSHATLPTAAGHYYLTENVSVVKADLAADVVLCLNGKTATCDGSYNTANDRFYYLKNSGTLTIVDCTASGEGDDYKAGKITGASASAFMFDNVATSVGSINVYDGIFEENFRSSSGGVFAVQGKGTLNIYGGLFVNNSTNSSGAVINTSGNDNHVYIENAIFKNNTANSKGGVLYNAYAANVTIKNSVMTGNTADIGGVIHTASALTLDGVKITGNITTESHGAVTLAKVGAQTVTLKGDTQITGNTDGAATGAVQRNLYLTAAANKIAVDGLATTAKIGVNGEPDSELTAALSNADAVKGHFVADDATMEIVVEGGKLVLTGIASDPVTSDHIHCICGDLTCTKTDGIHKQVPFLAWGDDTKEKTKLPTSGNYYLVDDVVLSTYAQSTGELNLCLNGHTVSLKEGVTNMRLLAVNEGTVLSITDCKETGKMTGGNRTYGSLANIAKNGTFNFYGGTITGNVNEDTSGGMGTIYAGGENAVVNIYGGEISGNKAHWGAAVYGVAKAYVNVYGGVICNNEAYRGGAIYATNILLDGATIRGNHTTSNGGGIYAGGGVATIKNSVIEGNRSDSSAGAIMASGRGTKLTIDNTIIKDNHGGGYAGGAIQAQTTGTELNITNSQFIGNTIVSNGGAIYMSYDTILNVDTTIFTGNTAEKGACIFEERALINLGKGVVMEGNIADTTNANPARRAAGIYMAAGELNIDGAVIKNNYGLKNGQQISVSGVAITTTHSDETVKDENGQDTKVRHYSTVNMLSGSIVGNKANSGAVLIQGKATFNLKGGEISNNTGSYGGGVYISTNATFNMSGGKISNNSAKSAAGGVYAQECTINITGGTISGNTSEGNAGGIYGAIATINLKGGTITGNTAKNSGGGIFASGSTVKLSGTSITYNKADKGSGGGGICTGARGDDKNPGVTLNAKIFMTGGYIAHNDSKNGGGILLQGADGTYMVMSGGIVANNNSRGDGGGVYVSSKTTFTMTGGKIYRNTAAGRGGAVNHLKSTGIYTGGEIYENHAENTAGAIQAGNVGTNVTIKNMVFRDNDAVKFGGTFQMNGTASLYLENVEIHGSKCETAGALYVSNSHYFEAKNLTITDSHATKSGGAMYLGNDATVRIDGLTVENCTAENRGGAIYCRSANTIIKNATFIGNEAVKYGGAISLYKPTLQGVAGSSNYKEGFVLNGGVFRDNKTEGYGGALTVDATYKCTMTDIVMENNTAAAEGSAIYALGETTVDGLTATGNTSTGNGYAVYYADSEYDGQSYINGMMRLGGDIIIKDNKGGDMYLGEKTTASILRGSVGAKTEMHVTLASGVLTQKLYGAYNYEGGELVYTVTYGDRSLTDPEYDETLVSNETEETELTDVLLYAGLGVFALIVVAAAVVVIALKKKKANAANAVSE